MFPTVVLRVASILPYAWPIVINHLVQYLKTNPAYYPLRQLTALFLAIYLPLNRNQGLLIISNKNINRILLSASLKCPFVRFFERSKKIYIYFAQALRLSFWEFSKSITSFCKSLHTLLSPWLRVAFAFTALTEE